VEVSVGIAVGAGVTGVQLASSRRKMIEKSIWMFFINGSYVLPYEMEIKIALSNNRAIPSNYGNLGSKRYTFIP
jgi:hypothetical protein